MKYTPKRVINNEVDAREYAKKWTSVYGTSVDVLESIAKIINIVYCSAKVSKGRLLIG